MRVTNGNLVQHVHLQTQAPGEAWVPSPYVYRTALGLRFALTHAGHAGHAVSWRFCDDDRCTGGGWPHGTRTRRPPVVTAQEERP